VVTLEELEVIGAKRWGLVPKWASAAPATFLRKTPTFNAFSEYAYDKRSFKNTMESGRRCLIPVTAFFEWQQRNVPNRKTLKKVPYRIHLKDERIFCLGGIYENGTYSVLTRSAQTLMAEIHNSKKHQPVIIPRVFESDWLSASLNKQDVLHFCDSIEEHDLVGQEIDKMPS
jgi:putative SOS response-associated peptidase YedK